jgi:hypothetical protein
MCVGAGEDALPEGGGWRVLGGEARRPAGGSMCGAE